MKLDDAFYKLVDKMESFIPPGNEPSLVNAKALTVKGPVRFSKGECRGWPPVRLWALLLPLAKTRGLSFYRDCNVGTRMFGHEGLQAHCPWGTMCIGGIPPMLVCPPKELGRLALMMLHPVG